MVHLICHTVLSTPIATSPSGSITEPTHKSESSSSSLPHLPHIRTHSPNCQWNTRRVRYSTVSLSVIHFFSTCAPFCSIQCHSSVVHSQLPLWKKPKSDLFDLTFCDSHNEQVRTVLNIYLYTFDCLFITILGREREIVKQILPYFMPVLLYEKTNKRTIYWQTYHFPIISMDKSQTNCSS